MVNLRRYFRAFWGALRMTLRGEVYTPPVQQSPLNTWINQYAMLVTDVLRAANQNGVDVASRKQIKLRLDGRSMSLETALMTLKFHAEQEYPSLVRQGTGRSIQNALYATNMNDRYWVSQMVNAPELQVSSIQKTLASLDSHLDTIPKLD
jgi:hypothetical protein